MRAVFERLEGEGGSTDWSLDVRLARILGSLLGIRVQEVFRIIIFLSTIGKFRGGVWS